MTFLITFALTALGLVASWGVHKRRGSASGMRWAAWSLVPFTLYLIGIVDLLKRLTLDPRGWAGIVLAGLVVVLYVTSGVMLGRRSGGDAGSGDAGGSKGAARPAVERKRDDLGGDSDLADIEAILRKRGIS